MPAVGLEKEKKVRSTTEAPLAGERKEVDAHTDKINIS